ncbi:MAG TPA: transketolase [Gemmatimonadales bacterium]|nr:transketolase [Gemmatimonadales bacterium]
MSVRCRVFPGGGKEPDLKTDVSPPGVARDAAPGAAPDSAVNPWVGIDAIRALAMDAVEQAQSGHPGTPMALAPLAYTLWTRFLTYNPQDPAWPDRDRFLLSAGHASMLQYSLLHLAGYELTLDDIRGFRQWSSRTPGHPERGHTPGVETTTGPLGQGVGNAVGMAMAERLLAQRFNRPGHEVVNHRVWAIASDGDMMEGVASESASLAGHLKLAKLTIIYDDNHITIDGDTALAFSEDVGRRFEAYDWRVLRVDDANDLAAISRAFEAARAESQRPTLIILRSIIADPAPTKRNTAEAHGAPLGAEEIRRTKEIMGWPVEPPFSVPPEAYEGFRGARARGERAEAAWRERLAEYTAEFPDDAAEFKRRLAGELPPGWDRELPTFGANERPMATRKASALVLPVVSRALPELVGGSADLGGSTGVTLKEGGTFGPSGPGRVVHWGVREHGMGAVMNGMAAHGGVRPFGSTFLIFTDYMKPAIRLASLMRLPVIYIGTHDSIGLGEDGPTHQPVEQLAMLRAIPGMTVVRPADATETVEAWRVAVEHRNGPVLLVLTRQNVPVLDRTKYAPAGGVGRGGYVLWDPPGGKAGAVPDAILIATGSEVHIALAASDRLLAGGIRARVVSLPSWELFDGQPAEYRESVLPAGVRARVGIEAASPFGWRKYLTDAGVMLAMPGFGASAPAERLFQEFKLTPEYAAATVRQLLGRSDER